MFKIKKLCVSDRLDKTQEEGFLDVACESMDTIKVLAEMMAERECRLLDEKYDATFGYAVYEKEPYTIEFFVTWQNEDSAFDELAILYEVVEDKDSVYALICDWATEDAADRNVTLFNTYDKAAEDFKAAIADEKASDWYENLPDRKEEESDDCWEAWEDGYYSGNHSSITIEKLIVR